MPAKSKGHLSRIRLGILIFVFIIRSPASSAKSTNNLATKHDEEERKEMISPDHGMQVVGKHGRTPIQDTTNVDETVMYVFSDSRLLSAMYNQTTELDDNISHETILNSQKKTKKGTSLSTDEDHGLSRSSQRSPFSASNTHSRNLEENRYDLSFSLKETGLLIVDELDTNLNIDEYDGDGYIEVSVQPEVPRHAIDADDDRYDFHYSSEGSGLLRLPRQAAPLDDSESGEYEGSGRSSDDDFKSMFEVTLHVQRPWRYFDYFFEDSDQYRFLEDEFKQAFNLSSSFREDTIADIMVKVRSIRPSPKDTLLVTFSMSVSGYELGKDEVDKGIRNVVLESQYLGSIPVDLQYFQFYPTWDTCSIGQYQCLEGSCIAENKKCDMTKDCREGEDEIDCVCAYSSGVHCDGGHCLPDHRICDGVYDCIDRKDEDIVCVSVEMNATLIQRVKRVTVEYNTSVELVCSNPTQTVEQPSWSAIGKPFLKNVAFKNITRKSSLVIEEVQPENSGLYRCTNDISEEITFLDVKGFIPRFNGRKSKLILAGGFKPKKNITIEMSFKPESENGTLLFMSSSDLSSSDRKTSSNYVKLEIEVGYVVVEYQINGVEGLIGTHPLAVVQVNEWHNLALTLNTHGGFLVLDNKGSITSSRPITFNKKGVDLSGDIHVGDSSHTETEFKPFRGCISRLVIQGRSMDFMKNSRVKENITSCSTCVANTCPENGLCYESYGISGYQCTCQLDSPGGVCKHFSGNCYPGLCGTGRCLRKGKGFECQCQFGTTGTHCQEDTVISEPSFQGRSFMVLPLYTTSGEFTFALEFKTETLDDTTLLAIPYQTYYGEDRREFSLVIRNGRVILRFKNGKDLISSPIQPERWTSVSVNVTIRFITWKVGNDPPNVFEPEEEESEINQHFFPKLLLGGEVNLTHQDMKIKRGFRGCIRKLHLMGKEVNFSEDLILTSVNVNQCKRCGSSIDDCLNGGSCITQGEEDSKCLCPPGFTGAICEQGLGECPSETLTVLDQSWVMNATSSGKSFTAPCPGDDLNYGIWTCGYNEWNKTPDLSRCRSHANLFLQSNDSTMVRAADNMTELFYNMRDEDDISPGDLLEIMKGLEFLQKLHEGVDVEEVEENDAIDLSERYLDALVNVTSDTLGHQDSWHFIPELQRREASNVLQESIVEAALTQAKYSESDLLSNYSQENADVFLVKKPTEYFEKKENRLYNHTSFMGTHLLLPEHFYDGYTQSTNASEERAVVAFNSFKNLHCLINEIPCDPAGTTFEKAKAQVNSGIIGATVGFKEEWKMKSNKYVKLNFTHIYDGSNYLSENVKCVWWNTETLKWSSSGCELNETNHFYTICHCDHLTNLAVIMDLRGLLDRHSALWTALRWITIVGCSISILCLAVGVVCFHLLKVAREKKKSDVGAKKYMIRLHMCVCLLIAEFVLLCGLDATENKIMCTTVAAILHFFFLSVFVWSAIESFNLYLAVKKVFETNISQKHFIIAGYGIPCLVVGLTLAISQTNGYGTEHACWLAPSGIIWSFAGTLAIIMLINLVGFGMVMNIVWKEQRSATMGAQNASSKPNHKKVIGSIAVFLVLGLTWITGFFFMLEATKVLAVVFTLLNSLQGAFIIFFGIVFEEEVRKEIKTIIEVKFQDGGTPSLAGQGIAKFSKITAESSAPSGSSEVELGTSEVELKC